MSETAITKTVVLAATRDDVWHALTSPDELSAWLGHVVELDARPGGAVIIREPPVRSDGGSSRRPSGGRRSSFDGGGSRGADPV